MVVGVVNQGSLPALAVKKAVSAVGQQVARHFAPAWGLKAGVVLGTKGADALVYLRDEADIDGALGYHESTNAGVPRGFVFPSVSAEYGEEWSVTLSHEVLELLGNPYTYGYALGKHPVENRDVLYWQEVCDPTQGSSYAIGSVLVSDFVLPHYFTRHNEPGRKNNYLATSLKSLGLDPGGYLGYYDPAEGEDVTYFPETDKRAQARFDARQAVPAIRRGALYKSVRARNCARHRRK